MAYFPGEVDGSIRVVMLSAGGWLLFHQTCMLLLGRLSVVRTLTASEKADAGILVVSFFFSVMVTIGASMILVDPDPVIMSDIIYGFSPRAQFMIAFSSGFFLWNLFADHSTVSKIMHHVSCIFVYTFALYPTFHLMALICLLWEGSTPLLSIRSMLILMKRNNTPLFGVVNTLFAVVFFVIRILVGVPSSVLWWIRVVPHVFGEPTGGGVPLHSHAVIYAYLGGNILLNGLNVWWMVAFLRRFFKSKKSVSARDGAGEGSGITKKD